MRTLEHGRAATALIGLIGAQPWLARLSDLRRMAGGSERVARAVAQRHAVEGALERLRQGLPMGPVERSVGILAADAVALHGGLGVAGQVRMIEAFTAALSGDGTLVGLFHLLRVAAQHRARGFQVRFDGFAEGAPFDLLIARGGSVAEIDFLIELTFLSGREKLAGYPVFAALAF